MPMPWPPSPGSDFSVYCPHTLLLILTSHRPSVLSSFTQQWKIRTAESKPSPETFTAAAPQLPLFRKTISLTLHLRSTDLPMKILVRMRESSSCNKVKSMKAKIYSNLLSKTNNRIWIYYFRISSSYPYISPFDPKKDQKNYRDSDGKVIVQQPNVQTSLTSKISYNKSKEFKYTE